MEYLRKFISNEEINELTTNGELVETLHSTMTIVQRFPTDSVEYLMGLKNISKMTDYLVEMIETQ